jgi:DNA-binding transcriptional LysR family regulator
MELREMRAFIAVVEEGGLSAAAHRLHVSQPALSQTINSLERQLGVQLLVRTRTGAQPTDAGMTLLAEARAVLARYDQALAAVTSHAAAGGNVLRLGIPLELPPDLLTQPLSDLAAAYPSTRVKARHLSTSAQLTALRGGELDVGLVCEHPVGQDLDAMLVVEERLGVLLAAGPAERLAGPDGIRLDALAGLDVLVNNAGIFPFGPTERTTEEDFGAVFTLNVKAPYFMVAQLAPETVRLCRSTAAGSRCKCFHPVCSVMGRICRG